LLPVPQRSSVPVGGLRTTLSLMSAQEQIGDQIPDVFPPQS
jgi:hypothetical protein